MSSDIVAALSPVVDVFEDLHVPYSVGGSVASSAHGIARSTLDIGLVADLGLAHVDRLVRVLEDRYYIDRDAIEDAVKRRTMVNLIHFETMLKVDVYVLKHQPFDMKSFERRIEDRLEADDERLFFMATPEDTVLHKLDWYRAGGEVSERQWSDVIGVLKVQSSALDIDYLRTWAASLGIAELLERAIAGSRR
jgi:hypothetical protein